MDQTHWKAVNDIFHAALEVSPSDRHAFVVHASDGDLDLQAEVELLLKADEDAGSYIESPLIPQSLFASSAPPLNPGEMLCGRFRITRVIAEGGMGYVYEAFDSELAVPIAVKIIRPEIASNPEALARFRQEVRLARRITHPNICRTFDIERHTRVIDSERCAKQEVMFLTMEFLEGETLAARIKRTGALPLDEALKIARQIAEALDSAHSLGIVHRDIKPANIMLVAAKNSEKHDFRVVVMDFGLARLDPLISSGNLSALSHTARPIGTLAYMAPEQLEGTQISAATDIYAFGLVLFEIVAGTRAFPSENLLSGIAQRLAGPAPNPRSLVPDLPLNWERAIERCLHVKPAERLQSAVDVLGVLEGKKVRTPTPRRDLLGFAMEHRQLFLTYAATLFVCVALLAGGLRLYQSRADSKVEPGALVYLTQVRNDTGERAFDNLTELIRAGLAQSVQVNLLDQGRVGDILQKMTKPPDAVIDEPTAREIAMRAGAVRVVFATVSGSNGDYKLHVDIQQPDNTPARYRSHWTRTFAWRSAPAALNGNISQDLLTTVRIAGDWIRHEAGESANDIARLDVPPEDVTTSSWQALADYTQAEDLAAQGKREEAVYALQAAVELDGGFALAYARLGDIEVNLAHRSEGYQAYLKALDEETSDRLSLRERNRIKGIYALDTGDFENAENAFRDSARFYEHDYLSWFYRGYPLAMLGRDREAIDVLERAHSAAPEKFSPLVALVQENLVVGDLQTARKWENDLRATGTAEWADEASGLIEFVAGDLVGAQKSFQSMSNSAEPMPQAEAVRLQADLAAEQGKYWSAIDILSRGLNTPSETSLKLLNRAYLYGKVGRFAESAKDIESALQTDDSPDAVLMASGILGRLLPSAKGPAARALDAVLESLTDRLHSSDVGVISQIARLRVDGEVSLRRGNFAEALKQFPKADKLEAPVLSREYLGRVYEAMAHEEQNRAAARRNLELALAAYGRIASNETAVWRFPTIYPPGFYADALEDWLRVAGALGMKNGDVESVHLKLSRLRHPSVAWTQPQS